MQSFLNKVYIHKLMEIKVIEDKKSKFVFETTEMGHTFLNVLKDELNNDSHVKIATYSIRHPIVSKPKFILETDGSVSPRAAISGAVSRLKKTTDKIRKDAIKEIK